MIKVCKKCGTKFEVTKGLINYCSLKCRNSRGERSEEVKEKIRNGLNQFIISDKYIKKVGDASPNWKPKIEKICLYCNQSLLTRRKTQTYHSECAKKCTGGIRVGSGRGKHGWYKGYWCDSSWELAWVIYHIDHEIKFERNKVGFEYIFEDKKRKYYPDFIKDGIYYEIKGYINNQVLEKIKQFPWKLVVLTKHDIKYILEYVISKYGRNYITLYNKNVAVV